MTVTRHVADPLFAPATLAADLPSLVTARRDAGLVAERATAVERARRGDAPDRRGVCEALGIAGGRVPVETVRPGDLDAAGREPAARTLLRHLDDATRWGVLTDGRYWRLYGGDDPDEQRYHEFDLRPCDPGGRNDATLDRFVALFAAEAFETETELDADASDPFLDALDAADTVRRRRVRDSLCDQFVAAVATLRDDDGCPSTDAAAGFAFRLTAALFVADRTGTAAFGDGTDALRSVRTGLADAAHTPTELAGAVGVATDGPEADIVLDGDRRATLRAWAAAAADAPDGAPFAAEASAVRTDRLADRTLERVGTLLTSVVCAGRSHRLDYRTVDARFLADAHERLLDVGYEGDTGGRPNRRKAEGSFYTPESVVAYLTDATVGSLAFDARAASPEEGGTASATAVRDRLLDARVADPAMGGGTLLVAAAQRLTAAIRRAAREADAPVEPVASIRRAVVSRCLYGVDRSPTAVAVARLACRVETLGPETGGDGPSLATHLRCGDALLGPGSETDRDARAAGDSSAIRWRAAFSGVFDDENSGRSGVGFDAVLGNPPWKGTAGRADISARIDRATSAHLREAFDSTAGPQPNLYAAFLERARRLAPDGYVAFVVPDAILVRLSAAPARRFLIDSGGLTHLLRVGHAFPDTNEGAALVVCGPAASDTIRTWFGDADAFAAAVDIGTFDYDRLRRGVVADEPYARFQLLRDDVADGIFRKLERLEPFEAVGSVARGEEFGKRDDRVRPTPTPTTRPIVPGSAVRQYALCPGEIGHVAADAVTKPVYDPPKVLCRQTGRFLVGTLDTEGVANLKSVYDLHAGDERRSKHVLGMVNSTVYNYYQYVQRNAYPAQFPQHTQRNFETLPVWPGAADDELVSLVDRRLAVGRERASLTTAADSVVPFADATVPLDRFGPAPLDDDRSRSHRGETPGLRIAALDVRERRSGHSLRATYEFDAGRETREVFRFEGLAPRDAVVLSTWIPAVGAATMVARRATGLRQVGRSARTTPAMRLRALRLPDPATHASALARYARDCRRATVLDDRAATLDDRIDARVAALCGLTAAEHARVRETLASVPGWAAVGRRED